MKTIRLVLASCIAGSALLLGTVADAATVTFVKKVQAGTSGNWNYTYSYVCNNGKKGQLTLSAANDNEAGTLAQQDAEQKCGES